MRAPVLLMLAACNPPSGENQFCKQATLYAGDPLYGGTAMPPSGTAQLADPPLDIRALAFGPSGASGGNPAEVVISTPTGLWTLAGGLETPLCPTVTFTGAQGLAFAADGTTLVVADAGADQVLLVDSSCAVTAVTGTLAEPAWPVLLADGTIDFLDAGNRQVKTIDATNAAIALTNLDGGTTWTGMTFAVGKLYLSGNGPTTSTMLEVDPTDGAQHVIAMGGGLTWLGADPNGSAGLQGVATNGDVLFSTGAGWIWRVSRDGREIQEVGGTGFITAYPVGYDPIQEHGADNLALLYTEGRTALAYSGSELYLATKAIGPYVESIGCK